MDDVKALNGMEQKGMDVLCICHSPIKRPFMREPTKNGKGQMADMYETYFFGSYMGRDNLCQNSKFLYGP